MNLKYFIYRYCHLYSYHWNDTCIAWIYKKNNNLYIGVFLEYVVNACGSWFLMKGAPQVFVEQPRGLNNAREQFASNPYNVGHNKR